MSRRPTVVVTRAEGADGPLSRALTARGAEVVCLPTIGFLPPEDPRPLEEAFFDLSGFDWLAVTSPHAAEIVATRWSTAIAAAQPRLRVAAVGGSTAAPLLEAGLRVDLVSARTDARGLAAALTATGSLRGTRLLWPRSSVANLEFADALRAAGATVSDPAAYRTLHAGPSAAADALRERLERGEVDAVTFLSPSAVNGLLSAWGEDRLPGLLARTLVASLGPVTSAALRAAGAAPGLEASERRVETLADAVVAALTPPIGAPR